MTTVNSNSFELTFNSTSVSVVGNSQVTLSNCTYSGNTPRPTNNNVVHIFFPNLSGPSTSAVNFSAGTSSIPANSSAPGTWLAFTLGTDVVISRAQIKTTVGGLNFTLATVTFLGTTVASSNQISSGVNIATTPNSVSVNVAVPPFVFGCTLGDQVMFQIPSCYILTSTGSLSSTSNTTTTTNSNNSTGQTGQFVNANGQLVNTNGQFVNANGQVVNTNGQFVGSNGQVVNANGQIVTTGGQRFCNC